ncbi:MAG TPA: alpha/beta hydrolase [Caulobacteraceae bacterium]|jgi:pimeloyl-ACP methyl ester carboxylesterase
MRHAVACKLLLAAALAATSSVARAQEQTVRLPDGRQMALACAGSGRSTVVFEAGLGSSMRSWALVMDGLQKQARVCAYDRAGYPGSDAGPVPRDADHVVADLHAMLRAAKLTGPFVLVGESVGGYYVRLYADLYPRDVAGMVLVDPAFPGEAKATAKASPSMAADLARRGVAQQVCLGALAKGQSWSETDPRYANCGAPPRNGDAASRAKATMSEEGSADHSGDQVAHAQGSRPDVPVIVLTADRATDQVPGMTAAERLSVRQVLVTGHQAIARGYPRGRQRTVANTSEAIQNDQPGAVIAAVREVLAQGR